MKVAVIGCAHGELVDLYQAIEDTEKQSNSKISLVLCCGDFQACRTHEDLQTMACPPKYRSMNSFHEYYSGKRIAPVLTLFVGGNHEASNHLQELPYGGWVAPNMYFLGYSGCVRVNNELVVAGLSGIYNPAHYSFGRFERVPYSESMLRSVFHVKRHDVRRLEMLAEMKKSPVDVFLSHDWPDHVACSSTRNDPNVVRLLQKKPFFRAEVERDDLGSPANRELMKRLKPTFWFAAHMHCKFAAIMKHTSEGNAPASSVAAKDPDEIDLDDEQSDYGVDQKQGSTTSPAAKRSKPSDDEDDEERTPPPQTKFLALDKIVKGRDFMQVIEVPMERFDATHPLQLSYDRDWLAIIKASHTLTPLQRNPPSPSASEFSGADLQAARVFLDAKFAPGQPIPVPSNFTRTVGEDSPRAPPPQRQKGNPQMDAFLAMLELDHLPTLTVPWTPSTIH